MVKKVSLLCLSTFLLFVGIAFALDVVDELPKGSINWSKGTVTAKGSGVAPSGAVNPSQARLLAERAAISDARRNLLETVGEVRVDASSTVSSMMTKNDVITSRISGIVKGSSVTGKRFLDDGSIEVTVEMPITGAFLDVMLTEVKAAPSITMTIPLPKSVKKDVPRVEVKIPVTPAENKKTAPEPQKAAVRPAPTMPATPSTPAEPAKEVKSSPEPERIDLSKVNYSGLIIDAREVEVKPALMPKVLNEKGEVIYSSANMQKEEAVKTGVVGYAKEVDAAKKHPRVTETPVVVAALKGSGEKRSDVIISDGNARTITTTEPALGYLKKGRVMIVYR